MFVKSVAKTDFMEMKILAAAELTQTRGIAEYILKERLG